MYEVPTSEQLREFAQRNELTGSAAAGIVGVDPRTWRKWTASEGADNKRAIPWSAWTLLRLYVGEISVDQYRLEVICSQKEKKNDTEVIQKIFEAFEQGVNPVFSDNEVICIRHLIEEGRLNSEAFYLHDTGHGPWICRLVGHIDPFIIKKK
jgi:hypothetical protein